MGYDAFGTFRGWCTRAPSCLEYVAAGEADGPAIVAPLRCSRCRCLPQEHVPCNPEGYDPNSKEHLAERQKHDVRLLPPEERAAIFKGRADAQFKQRNYRNAYLDYTRALEATPDDRALLANRCQTYLKVSKNSAALTDAERCVNAAPDWPKAHYRHGSALVANERFAEAVTAFERACELDPSNSEAQKALTDARTKHEDQVKLEADLAKARKRTTIRQANEMYEEEKFMAKRAAKDAGKIKQLTNWGGELADDFDRQYKANIRPPAGVEYALTYKEGAEGAEADARVEDVTDAAGEMILEENGEGECEMVLEANEEDSGLPRIALEDNVEEIVPGEDSDSDDDSSTVFSSEQSEAEEKAAIERAQLDDSRWVPEVSEGSTALSLPPRNYTLVHEDGRLHKKDNFEPMSFGMQRIHKDDRPEPVWVQTPTARWLQSLVDVTIIPWKVPKELCRSSEIRVSFSRRQVHVQAVLSKVIYMAGELQAPIDPNQSTWTTDGEYITITCIKENLMLYNGAKGQESDSHWPRLFVTDQFVERGMIAADYCDLPDHMKHAQKMGDLKTKAKENAEKEANLCPLCDKDIRFFCSCRDNDKDYERPLPQGWKDSKLGFSDNYDKYSLAEPNKLKKRPPSPPRPYQGAYGCMHTCVWHGALGILACGLRMARQPPLCRTPFTRVVAFARRSPWAEVWARWQGSSRAYVPNAVRLRTCFFDCFILNKLR